MMTTDNFNGWFEATFRSIDVMAVHELPISSVELLDLNQNSKRVIIPGGNNRNRSGETLNPLRTKPNRPMRSLSYAWRTQLTKTLNLLWFDKPFL